MELIYVDETIVVAVKPARVLSTDEPGGMPELVRQALGQEQVRTVHRLDRVVSGLMVLARTKRAASELSRQIRDNTFQKEYVAILHGGPEEDMGTLRDLLLRNRQERKTYIVNAPGKDVQEAILNYRVINRAENMTRVRIELVTGRTHQIRAQFSGRGWPLVGERKYAVLEDPCEIALWSYRLAFRHPITEAPMEFILEPPGNYPWTVC